jgi:fibronectin type 3 domain-containing protein
MSDAEKVIGDPQLPLPVLPDDFIFPRWDNNQKSFLSGNTTIRQEFVRLANTFGVIPSDSSAIDQANPNYAPVDDILGRSRATGGSAPDLGAFEYGATYSDITPPAAITDLIAATGTNPGEVDLTWTAPGDDGTTGQASKYIIKYSTSEITDANWDLAITVGSLPSPKSAGAQESFTVTGLTQGQLYYFAIKTQDEIPNISNISNSPNAKAQEEDKTPPNAPRDLVVTETQSYSLTLSWQAPEQAVDGDIADLYKIYQGTSPGVTKTTGTLIETTNLLSFTDNAVLPETTYYYVITAIDDVGNEGSESNEVSTTTPQDTTPPSAPTGLTGSPGDMIVNLSWNANLEADLAGYRVYRSLTSGGPYNNVDQVGKDTTSYQNTKVFNMVTYYYVVTAIDKADNDSDYSNEVTVIPGSEPVTVVFQQGDGGAYSNCLVVAISSVYKTYGNSTGTTSKVDESGPILIAFPDIIGSNPGQIAAGSTIVSAALEIKAQNVQSSVEGLQLEIYRILDNDNNGPWVEGIATGYDTGASFDKRDDRSGFDIEWTQAGLGDSVLNSKADIPDSVFTIPNNYSGQWASFDVRSSIQAWVNGEEKQGWVIVQPLLSTDHYWYSDDAENIGDRPKLTITYVPEPPSDTTPPATITDVKVSSGSSDTEKNLAWTAPGDDGDVGTANLYIVKYAVTLITDSSPFPWDAATEVSGAPTPQAAGSQQSMLVTGLPTLADGEIYRFAIRAMDDAGNISDLDTEPPGVVSKPQHVDN